MTLTNWFVSVIIPIISSSSITFISGKLNIFLLVSILNCSNNFFVFTYELGLISSIQITSLSKSTNIFDG